MKEQYVFPSNAILSTDRRQQDDIWICKYVKQRYNPETSMTERGNFVLNGNRHFPFSSSHPLPFPFFSSLSFFLPFTILLRVVHTIISYYSTLARKSDTVGFFNLLDATQFKFIRCIELKFHTQTWQWLNISIWSSIVQFIRKWNDNCLTHTTMEY